MTTIDPDLFEKLHAFLLPEREQLLHALDLVDVALDVASQIFNLSMRFKKLFEL